MSTVPGPGGSIPDGTFNISSSSPIFAFPALTDVKSSLIVTGSDGNKYAFTILNTTNHFFEQSSTFANALPSTTIPAGVTFPASTSWAWARPTISGLTWLEGKTVSILADGAVQPQQVVNGGAVNVQHPAVRVTIGISYTAEIATLPLVMQIDASGQGRTKNINKVWVRVYRSSSIFAGPSLTSLTQYAQRTTENYGEPPNLVTGEIEIVIPPSWQSAGQVYVQQTDPLPLTVVGLTVEAVIGG